MSCSRNGSGINFCGGSKESIKVILFHANWCGHCKTFINSGNWQKIQNLASNLPITFEKYEEREEKSEEANNLLKKGIVKGWPTIVIIKDGNDSVYNGSRDPNDMIMYLKKLVNSDVVGGSVNLQQQNKYSKMPAQCGGTLGNNPKGGSNINTFRRKSSNSHNDYYKLKYLKYKAKYLSTKSKQN